MIVFGNRFACSSCVVRRSESFGRDTKEEETNGPLEQHLPEREWTTLSRAKPFLGMSKKGGTMKLQSKIATSLGLMLLLACVSFAQHVKTDYDHSANFGQYKTYSWEKVQTKDPLLVDRIKSAVNSALASKGWTEAPSGGDVRSLPSRRLRLSKPWTRSTTGSEEVAAGDSVADLATPPQRSKPTKWGP